MVRKSSHIAAGEFKAKCLALLDDVADRGEEIVVTKRGKPVARVVPVEPQSWTSLKGTVLFERDIVSPADEAWEIEE